MSGDCFSFQRDNNAEINSIDIKCIKMYDMLCCVVCTHVRTALYRYRFVCFL